ncbi:MAG: hypothetical protein HN413_00610 [Chloroflexi bacterium]|nr:hypothetical protein [Chloroflexota bacterium]
MLATLTILLILISLASGPLYLRLLHKKNYLLAVALSGLLALLGSGLATTIFFSTGTFFVAGVTCLLIPVALISLLILRWLGQRTYANALQTNPEFRRGYWLGIIFIPILIAAPFFELSIIRSTCFRLNQGAAQGLIAAVEQYQAQQNAYPETLDALVPEYLVTIPPGKCAPLPDAGFNAPRFEILTCTPENITILIVPIGSGEWIQRYNFENGAWATLSFLDGACSYLEQYE